MNKDVHNLHELIEQYEDLPFSICVGSISMKGVFDIEVKDYFILRIRNGKITKSKGNIEIMEMSNFAKRQFLSLVSLFEIVKDNKDGKVYELKGAAGYFESKIKQIKPGPIKTKAPGKRKIANRVATMHKQVEQNNNSPEFLYQERI